MEKNNSLMWVVIAAVALLLLISFGFRGAGYGMMGMMYGSYGYGMLFFGWIFGILSLVAVVLFIVWIVKQLEKK
jgi:uncharacterized membrane protein